MANILKTTRSTRRQFLDATVAQFTVTDVKTADYTANNFERVLIDSSSAPFTITAPAAPTAGQRFGVRNVVADSSGVTISGNGNDIEEPLDPAEYSGSVTFSGSGLSMEWEFDGSQWNLVYNGNESYPLTRTLWVDNARDGVSSPNGSPEFPYGTINAALSAIPFTATAAQQLEQWVILVAPGSYDEGGDLSIPANRRISLVALGPVSVTSGGIDIVRASATGALSTANEPMLYVGTLEGAMAQTRNVGSSDTIMWTFSGPITQAGTDNQQFNLFLEGVRVTSILVVTNTGFPIRSYFKNVIVNSSGAAMRGVDAWHWENVEFVGTGAGTEVELNRLGLFKDCVWRCPDGVQVVTGLIDALESGFRAGFVNCYLENCNGSVGSGPFRLDGATLSRNTPTFTASADFKPFDGGDKSWTFSVSDTGVGLGPEYLVPDGLIAAPSATVFRKVIRQRALIWGMEIYQIPGAAGATNSYTVLVNGVATAAVGTISNDNNSAGIFFDPPLSVGNGSDIALQQTRNAAPAGGATNTVISLLYA